MKLIGSSQYHQAVSEMGCPRKNILFEFYLLICSLIRSEGKKFKPKVVAKGLNAFLSHVRFLKVSKQFKNVFHIYPVKNEPLLLYHNHLLISLIFLVTQIHSQ